ncbi:MAG TPA: hypothetical protein VHV56_00680 [Pseudolabrys sp.]|jgi:hypothetical protein|nr:hypothetical protein [Pseudolabrys sp.]
MDEFLQIREVIPFLEYENYPIVLAENQRPISIGDNGLIAFRSFDGEIICGDFNEVLQYVSAHKESLANNPILKSQLNRIEATELSPSYDVWRAVAGQVFESEKQQAFWVDSELQIFQKQKKIWTEIDTVDTETQRAAESGLGSPISELSTEYIIQWLNYRPNFLARDWTMAWHYVNERMPFDDRLVQIALNWMFFIGAENQDLHQIKSILYGLLEREKSTNTEVPGLGEFLSDRLAIDPSLIFSFLRPKRFLLMLISFLARNGEMDDVLRLITFCMKELPKEGYIVDALKYALGILISQTKMIEDHWIPQTHNREFEQQQIQLAQSLEEQLDSY